MSILEKVWILVGIIIIFIILSTDPKNSISGTANQQLGSLFSNASDGQKFIKQFNWLLIAIFFVLTLGLSYLG